MTLFLLAVVILVVASLGPGGVLFAVPALLPGAAAHGMWRGRRGARVVAIGLGVTSLLAGLRTGGGVSLVFALLGLVLVLLLTASGASREW